MADVHIKEEPSADRCIFVYNTHEAGPLVEKPKRFGAKTFKKADKSILVTLKDMMWINGVKPEETCWYTDTIPFGTLTLAVIVCATSCQSNGHHIC